MVLVMEINMLIYLKLEVMIVSVMIIVLLLKYVL